MTDKELLEAAARHAIEVSYYWAICTIASVALDLPGWSIRNASGELRQWVWDLYSKGMVYGYLPSLQERIAQRSSASLDRGQP